MKLVTVAEMRAIEKEADERGVSYGEMMERAGRGVAEIVDTAYSQIEPKIIVGLIGSGNNGGDTLIALESLAGIGWSVCAYLLRPRANDDELVGRVRQAGGDVIDARDDDSFAILEDNLRTASFMLDGVLGTGIQLPLKTELQTALSHIANIEDLPIVVAVDCPSGVDCDSGEVSPATIPADLTICMEAVKIGLMTFPANEFIGELEVVDLGLPDDLGSVKDISTWIITAEDVSKILPVRSRQAHKGTFGTALIAAGSSDFAGASLLAGEAAYRIGTGLVRMAVPASLHSILAGHFREAVWLSLPEVRGAIDANAAEILCAHLDRITALLIGPGIGMADTTVEFIRKVLDWHQRQGKAGGLPPTILDADALKIIARIDQWHRMLPKESILTPHPGEMSVLTGLSTAEIQANRIKIARKYASAWEHIVVLKGALSVVAAPDGRVYGVPVATPALARAGTGDVLAGLITGLRAQGVAAFESAAAGAWIHAQAGLLAAEDIGQSASVLAGDVLAAVPDVLAEILVE